MTERAAHRIPRPGRDGRADGGPPRRAPGTGHRLQPHARQGAKPGSASTAGSTSRPHAGRGGDGPGRGADLRRQRRRSRRGRARRRTARSRDGAGRAVRRPHHRLGRDRPADRRRKAGRRGVLVARRAGFGRAGRRRERQAVDHVRRHRRGDGRGRAGDRKPMPRASSMSARPAPGRRPRWSTRSASPACSQGSPKAVRFAQAAGLDLDKVFEAISGGAAQSWQMVNRWSTMSEDEFDFGFAVDWMRKDLGDRARRGRRATGRTCRSTALVDRFYAEVQAHGRRPAGHQRAGPAPAGGLAP